MEEYKRYNSYTQLKQERELANLKKENERLLLRIEELEKKNKSHMEIIKDNMRKFREANPTIAYNQKWSWVKKMAYLIHQADKPLQLNEISEKLYEIDKYASSSSIYHSNKIFCTHLLRAVKAKRLARCKISGNGGYFYCLPEWMNGYLLQEEYLKKIMF